MNTQSSSLKTGILIAVIIAISLGVYFYYTGSTSSDTATTATSAKQNNDLAGARVLALLNIVNSLNIDRGFFDSTKNPAYSTLVDHTIEIPPVNVGRPNPFAPLAGQASAAISSTTKASSKR